MVLNMPSSLIQLLSWHVKSQLEKIYAPATNNAVLMALAGFDVGKGETHCVTSAYLNIPEEKLKKLTYIFF